MAKQEYHRGPVFQRQISTGQHRTGENKQLEVEKEIIKTCIFFPKYLCDDRKAAILTNQRNSNEGLFLYMHTLSERQLQ